MNIDPNNFLSYPVWLSLKPETKYAIAGLFGLQARGVRETYLGHNDSRVISDGFVHSDLSVITKEKMTEITGADSDDFYVLWEALVNKVENKTIAQTDVQQEKPAEDVAPAKKAKGRPRKGAEAEGADIEG